LTEKYFFDTDCLSAFLWIRGESILEHITTGNILQRALDEKMITEDEGNVLWAEMIQKRRMLPTKTFSEFLRGNG